MIHVLTLVLCAAFSLCILQSLALHVKVWRMQDRRHEISDALARLKSSYDQSIEAAMRQIRVRHWWMAVIASCLCLTECLR